MDLSVLIGIIGSFVSGGAMFFIGRAVGHKDREQENRRANDRDFIEPILADMRRYKRDFAGRGPDSRTTKGRAKDYAGICNANGQQLSAKSHEAIKKKALEFRDKKGAVTEVWLDEFTAQLEDALKVIPPR